MVPIHLRIVLASAIATLFLPGAAQASLLGLYTFNGNALDSSGNGNNGTVHGNVSYSLTTPWGTQALTLPGGTTRNDYVSVPINSTVAGTPAETFGGWFYLAPNTPQIIRGMISNDDGSFDRTLDVDTRNGGYQWSAFIGGSVIGTPGGGNITPGSWTFVAVSYDNTGGAHGTYIFQVGTHQSTGSTNFDVNSVAGTTYIGINPNFDSEFQGGIADAFFFNTALSASDLMNIQANGPGALLGNNAVPEPASMVLLGAGMLGLGIIRRCQRRRR